MWATSSIEDESYFSLVLPVQNGGGPAFLMHSKKWPGFVAYIQQVSANHSKNSNKYALRTGSVENAITDLLVELVQAPEDVAPGAVMFKKFGKTEYAYLQSVHTSVSVVQTYGTDPGTGGYWYPNPKLPDEIMAKLPKYSGARCNYNCDASSKVPLVIGILFGLVVLCSCCCFCLPSRTPLQPPVVYGAAVQALAATAAA